MPTSYGGAVSENETPQTAGAETWENQPWAEPEPGRLMNKGHSAGDVVEAWKWNVLERGNGVLVVEAHLPDKVKNPRGQLFGGFTPTYVDLISLFTVHSNDADHDRPRRFLSTINMRCDYFEPIMGPTFVMRGELENQRGRTSLVSTKFFDGDTMLAHALTTLRMN